MIIKRISGKNFLSSGSGGIEIDFTKTGTTLMVGKSGSGKSLTIDLLCFILFNKPFRPLKKEQIVNSKNRKDCFGECLLQVGSNEYLIKRGIKPNIFEIYENNVLVNQDALSKDYQKYLEENILGTNFKTFTQIVVLGSKLFTPFMELKTSDRRKFIEDLLDLGVFSNMNIITKDRNKNLKNSIQDLEYEIQQIEYKKETKQKYIQNIRQKNDGIIDSIKQKIEQETVKVLEYDKQLQEWNQKRDQVLDQVFDTFEHEKKLNKYLELRGKLNGNKSNNEKTVKFFETYDECPTCRQGIDQNFKQDIVSKSSSKIEEIGKALVDLNSKIGEQNGFISEIKNNAQQFQKMESMIGNINSSKRMVENNIKSLEKDLTKAETQGTIDTTSDEKELKQFDKEIGAINGKLKLLKDEQKLCEYTLNILKDDGVKSLIIAEYLPVINKLINHYLGIMDFFVSFNFDENFDEVIKSRHRDIFSYNNFSAGQQLRINLAIMFTFRKIAECKNTCKCNLLIMDEVLDSALDSECLEIVTDMLKEFGDNNIFMISHRMEMRDKFERTLEFTLKNDYTTMREII